MVWYRLQDNQCRDWEFNPDGVASIIRSNIYHREVLAHARENRQHHWFSADTVHIESDTRRALATAESEAPRWAREGWRQAELNGEGFQQTLVHMRQEALAAGDRFRERSNRASSETQQNINRAADRDTTILNGLTAVRNSSAGILLAGATVLSGGAALGAATAGGYIRFQARIDDGGTVSQAAQETAIDLFVTFITRGAGRTLAQSPLNQAHVNMQNANVLAVFGMFTNTAADVAKTMVTGEVGRTPLQGARARLNVEAANSIISNILGRVALPVRIMSPATREAVDAVVGAGFGYVGDLIVNAARGVDPQAPSTSGSSSSGIPANTLLRTSAELSAADAWVTANAMRRM